MNNIKKLFVACSAMVAISGVAISNSMAYTGTVDKETVRLREKASTSSNILVNLDFGDEVEIISEDGDWYKVKFKTYEGYMYKEYIKVENTSNTQSNASSVVDDDENNEQLKPSIEPTQTPEETTKIPEPTEDLSEEQPETTLVTTTDVIPNNAETIYIGKEINIEKDASVYLLPVITSSTTGSIVHGTKIKIIEETNNWIKVTSSEATGWIFKSILSKNNIPDTTEKPEETVEPVKTPEPSASPTSTEEPEQTPTPNTSSSNKGIINVANANVREDASSTADVISSLTENTEVTILDEKNDFYKISTSTIKEGYVAKRLITLNTVTSRSGEPRAEANEVNPEVELQDYTAENEESIEKAQEIANFAEQFLGYDYVYGGTSPENGFDCSGYTYYVYNNNGVEIARDLVSQASIGSEVSEDEIEIGDLIIFQDDSMSGIGHSGIYIGNGEFIHAANPSRGVVTDSINNSYYNPRIVTIRRVV